MNRPLAGPTRLPAVSGTPDRGGGVNLAFVVGNAAQLIKDPRAGCDLVLEPMGMDNLVDAHTHR
ncbi:hypothetical protein QTI66_32860 [Variovorax sp. J22R133]|uniref:hypothetical protein n=1 Tax=Variovorax brevis TaxID=3053503 RepID=UPI0025780D38|nr:hypothetical protein [Variovorax sp. J22R133]MDM0116920.1 hypothetical protein [Variovorax sp. J22R133]